ncbi:unnamed protein product [Pseudo-nitzschia multistriata]|uniref:Beta-lactamase-related domain-containing protein n=1 Tax=Pseudo-nitzschia multistriata TaxID=183589 RepID=A0A448ZCV1_9STRA|nr:unnamed protein product [Pseudo-nitzschia multistriata]
MTSPPPTYITNRAGKKVRNPKHIAYMRQKNSKAQKDTENETAQIAEAPDTSEDGKEPHGNEKRDDGYYDKFVDLSRPWETAGDLATNPGARWCEREFSRFREVQRVTVVEDGKLVADYRRKGVGADETHHLFSTTKAVMSMLIGAVMEYSELVELNVTDTLGDIFPDDWAWHKLSGEELEYKKSIRVEELLTMTSGLISMFGGRRGILHMKEVSIADAPGSDLPRALAAPAWDPKLRGKFKYMPSSNILSYVIHRKTGLSPRAFGDEYVFSKLGIDHDKMDWDANANGVETSFSQLQLTTPQMCKIGQLYLQDGHWCPPADGEKTSTILSEDWIRASHTKHVFGDTKAGFDHWYGYLWSLYDREYHGVRSAGDCWSAPGLGGQLIAISKETNRVVAVSRSLPPPDPKTLIHHKKLCIKLLGNTMHYQPQNANTKSKHGYGGLPPPYIRNKDGKMVRNPEYIAAMTEVSDGLNSSDMGGGRLAMAEVDEHKEEE